MSQEERAAIEVRDRPCSIEVESNFKGEIAIRTKWYFEPTLESAWEAFQNLTKVRAALKVQYIGGNETEVEQSLAFLRQMTGVEVKTLPKQDYTEQLNASIDAIRAGQSNG